MFKACSKCGQIHNTSYVCTKGKIYRGGDERKQRSRYAWTLKSKEIREKANYLCEVCRDHQVYRYDNLEVHHIIKVKDDLDKLLDDYNLICLCVEHHKQADNNKINTDYLLKLAKRREETLCK